MTHPPTLLVLSPSTGGYYFGALLGGIARELAATGGRAVVLQTLEPGVRSDEIGEAPDFSIPVAWDEVDGVVSVTSAARGDYLSRLQERGRPVVVASSRLDGLVAPTAVPDNGGGTMAAVEHLIAHGHTRIGFAGNLVQRDIRDRHEAYVATLEAHGLEAAPQDLFTAPDNGDPGGRAAGAAYLRSTDRPTAVMLATDRNALGFMAVVQEAGVDVPGDLAVVGFDNIETSSFATPALTTIDQPFDEVGALAARLVLSQVRGGTVPAVPHTSPASVVVRASCGCRPGPGAPGTTTTDLRAVRRQTAQRLRHALVTGERERDAAVDQLVIRLLDLVDTFTTPATPEQMADPLTWERAEAGLAELRTALRGSARRADVLRRVTRSLDEYVRATTSPIIASGVLATLRDVQAAAFLRQSESVEAMLDEQLGVDAGLLDTKDPRSLDWLAGTHVRSAVLATWHADGDLRVAGVFDPAGEVGQPLGETVAVEHFPPSSLVRSARPEERLMCFVVPVRTREHDWGLLAVVAEIELSSARETYHHWAALLASALEQGALQAAVRESEERYALVSRAAQDGLWEFDTRTEHVYVSERGRDLLGMTPTEPAAARGWTRNVHPDDVEPLRQGTQAAVRAPGTAVEIEFRRRMPEGAAERWLLFRALAVPDAQGSAHRVVGSVSDIDRRKALEERLRVGALVDEVTGLPNRRLFLDRLSQAVEQKRRRPAAQYAVVFLDLDGFKLVNDSLGHLVGDQLLTVVAERLRDELRSVDTAARFGGDEFAVLLTDPVPDEVLVIARRIQEAIARPVLLAGHEVSVTASVGITTSDRGYTDAEDVLRDADIAMYEAKGAERGTASVFDPEMHARATGRLRERAELRAALAENQFVVHYQPIVALDGAGVTHFEALVRWQHPERGLLLPGAFLPALEENATIVPLGDWVLDEVCRQIAAWSSEHEAAATVAVNLSHAEFWSKDLAQRVRAALARHGVAPERLVLEITESVIMTDPDVARRVMDELHAIGVCLHIDDFGTGQSSLNALRSFPVDALKIDGSFIREMADVQTGELVRIIVEIGQVLGLEVVAECVETPDQATTLQAMGCENAQGWLYGRAVPGADAGLMLGRSLVLVP
ncbi:EAL domain-containing protein [Actinotalea ferrariae]|uniref:EAL domain-containing protein n=1 Tax=Actinotalea ferrariae TaxID=1386098 RepID=UPI001C8CB001|nr:EAL domain-containing protein [Actinotalea ferrariae]MBX9246320.1 EAL domain-containing protein [Actinotalea ferrariae]